VGGTWFESRRVSFSARPVSRERRLRDYPVGRKVAVFYDPGDPARAVLERDALDLGDPALAIVNRSALTSLAHRGVPEDPAMLNDTCGNLAQITEPRRS
jgi:hypothetical protein